MYFLFLFTDYPGPPRIALLPAETGDWEQLKKNKNNVVVVVVIAAICM